MRLKDRAICSSGFAVKGAHIMDPRTYGPVPIRDARTYASAPTAAMSDALSTAFMIMDKADIDALCKRHPGVEAIVL